MNDAPREVFKLTIVAAALIVTAIASDAHGRFTARAELVPDLCLPSSQFMPAPGHSPLPVYDQLPGQTGTSSQPGAGTHPEESK